MVEGLLTCQVEDSDTGKCKNNDGYVPPELIVVFETSGWYVSSGDLVMAHILNPPFVLFCKLINYIINGKKSQKSVYYTKIQKKKEKRDKKRKERIRNE